MALQESVVATLKGMVDPDESKSSMCIDIGEKAVNSMATTATVSLTYVVNNTPATNIATLYKYTDVVPYHTGMTLMLPRFGPTAMWHMGFVGAGTYSEVTTSTYGTFPAAATSRGFDVRGLYLGERQNGPGIIVPAASTNYNGTRLDFDVELALPRLGEGAGFQLEPQLDSNFALTRTMSGLLSIQSNSTNGTTLNLSGSISSAVLADTRDAAQNLGSNGVYRSYAPATMYQQSISRSDDLRSTPVTDGAVDLIGPDYQRKWKSPIEGKSDRLDSIWNTYDVSKVKTAVATGFGSALVTYGLINIAQTWVTPWQTRYYVSTVAGAGGPDPVCWSTINGPSINENGIYDINVSAVLMAYSNSTPATIATNSIIGNCNFVHVFAYVGNDGLVRYNMKAENTIVRFSGMNNLFADVNATVSNPTGAVQVPQPPYVFRSRPRTLTPGMSSTSGGKYIGTLCTLSAGAESFIVPADVWNIRAANVQITVRARNLMDEGALGPAHIMRYDSVAIGQALQFQGTLNLQAVPQGKISQYINNGNPSMSSLPSSLFDKLADILWNKSSYFKRICTYADYIGKYRPFYKSLTVESLGEIINLLPDESDRQVCFAMLSLLPNVALMSGSRRIRE